MSRRAVVGGTIGLGVMFGVLTVLSGAAEAQPPAGLALAQPYKGDCAVTVTVPVGADAAGVHVSIDSHPVTVERIQQAPFVGVLKDPLALHSNVTVTLGSESLTLDVIDAPAGGHANTSCAPAPGAPAPIVIDERSTFEASGFLGRVFDNFAPNEVANYANTTPGSTKSRWTAGVDAQYRLKGSPTSERQIWVSTQTLHGLRSGDVDCEKTPKAAICSKNSAEGEKFLYILEHASTMEAHIDARFEFKTLQVTGDTPVRAYVVSRFGFVAMENAPRVFNSDAYAGVGILSPRGTFKGSFAQVAWGRSEQFQSFPHANRLKIFGTLAFDLAPSFSAGATGFVGRMLGSSRAFVAIVVDRNLGGRAPEAVQTYVGYNFDLRKGFGSF